MHLPSLTMALLVVLALVASLHQTQSVANIAETFVGGNDMDAIIERFNKWMDDVGCESKVETAHIPGFRLGLIAREDIEEGENYLAVPWLSLIHEESILKTSSVGQQFSELKLKYELDTFHYLMLFFLRELDQPDSYWRPFLDILPGSLNTPIFWSDELLDALAGTKIPAEARNYRETARLNFEKDLKIISENVDLFGSSMPIVEHRLRLQCPDVVWCRKLWYRTICSGQVDLRSIFVGKCTTGKGLLLCGTVPKSSHLRLHLGFQCT